MNYLAGKNNMVKELVHKDILYQLNKNLLAQGWYISLDNNKITCKGRASHGQEREWVYVNPDPDRKCGIYRAIQECFGYIPSPCLDCWKVVVKPRTIAELMQLYFWQVEWTKDHRHKGRYCKCGVESRKYVPQNYGGYFYCNSKEHGLKRYAQVRAAVDKINPKIPVTLKRYCTEFEVELGPSDIYKQPEWAKEHEQIVFDNTDWEQLKENPVQPDFLRDHIIRTWFEFAWERADMTVMMFNENLPLYTPCVTYHEDAGEKRKQGNVVLDLGKTDLSK